MSEEEVVGTAIIRLVVDRSEADAELDRAAEEQGRKSSARAKQQGEKDGKDQGDAFSRALKTKLDAAFKSLPNAPDVMVGANIDEASAKLLRIKDELLTLRNQVIGVDITDVEAEAKIKELSAQLDILSRDRSVRVRMDAKDANASLGALLKQMNQVEEESKKIGTANEPQKQGMGLLLKSAILLGPALIPLAGGLAAAGTAAIGFGIVGLIAMQGITAEIAKGTKAGMSYQVLITGFKQTFSSLQSTVATGILPGLEGAVGKLRAQLPELNIQFAQSSAKLGQSLSNITGGFVSLLIKFNPLIQMAETGVVNLTAKFEAWANGAGGTQFMATLIDDMHMVGPLLTNLATTLTHAVAAFAPIGVSSLSSITLLSGAINKIPVGLLQAGAAAFIIYKTAAEVGNVFNVASKALTGFATAQTAAAAASTRLAGEAGAAGAASAASGLKGVAGSLGVILARAVPYVAVLAAVEIGTNLITKSTDKWALSQNKLTQFAGDALHTFKDIITLNFSDIGHFIDKTSALTNNIKAAQISINSLNLDNIEKAYGITTPSSATTSVHNTGRSTSIARTTDPGATADAEATYRKNVKIAADYAVLFQSYRVKAIAAQAAAAKANFADAGLNAQLAAYSKLAYDTNEKLLAQMQKLSAGDPMANATKQYQHNLKLQQDAANQYVKSVTSINDANYKNLRSTNDSSGAISKSSAAYGTLETQVQKNIDAESAYLATKKNETITVDGVKYSYAAYADARAKANGSDAVATGILKGHTIALADDKAMLAELLAEQNNINTAYAQAGVDLHLTTAQLDLFSSAIGITSSDLATGKVSANQFEQAMKAVKDQLMNANTSNAAWLASIDTFNKSGKTAADVAALLGAALKAARGPMLDEAGANLSAASAAEAAGSAIAQYSASIDQNGNLLGQLTKTTHGYVITQPALTAGSVAIANALTQQATAAQTAAEQVYQNEVSVKGSGVAAQDALDIYKGYRQSLIDTAISSGATAIQAQNLADKYLGIPKNVDTFIKQIGAKDVGGAIAGLTTAINGLTKNIRLSLGLDGGAATIAELQRVQDQANATAATMRTVGGTAFGGHLAAAQGGVFSYYAQGGIRAAEYYANGGESHIAQIAPAGSTRVWNEPETGGEAYIPMAPSKRSRSTEILAQVASQFGLAQHKSSGSMLGQSTATVVLDPRIDQLIEAIEAYLDRPVVLQADRIQLAKVVNDQNERNGRRA